MSGFLIDLERKETEAANLFIRNARAVKQGHSIMVRRGAFPCFACLTTTTTTALMVRLIGLLPSRVAERARPAKQTKNASSWAGCV